MVSDISRLMTEHFDVLTRGMAKQKLVNSREKKPLWVYDLKE